MVYLSPFSALLEACKMLALDVNEHQTVRHFGLSQSYDNGMQANGQEVELILLNLFKSTAPAEVADRLADKNMADLLPATDLGAKLADEGFLDDLAELYGPLPTNS